MYVEWSAGVCESKTLPFILSHLLYTRSTVMVIEHQWLPHPNINHIKINARHCSLNTRNRISNNIGQVLNGHIFMNGIQRIKFFLFKITIHQLFANGRTITITSDNINNWFRSPSMNWFQNVDRKKQTWVEIFIWKKIFQMPMSRVFSLMSRRLAELIRHFPNYLYQQKFESSKLGFLGHNLFTGNVNVMSLKHCRDWLTHQYNSQKTKMSNWVKVTNSKLW